MNYKNYVSILNYYKNYYKENIDKIKHEYNNLFNNYEKDKFKNLMFKQKQLVLSILNEVLKNYNDFDNIDSMIILTGSLSRNTNLLYSDIDISFIYDNKYKKDLLNIEEQISYLLSEIYNFRGRDRVHGITFYLPMISSKRHKCIDENNYMIKLKEKNIYYKCRDNAYETMYNTFNSTRSAIDLTDYVINNLSMVEDWTNCFELIKDNGLYETFKNKVRDYEKKNVNNYNYKSVIDTLINKINNDMYMNNDSSKMLIKDLKKIYKSEVFNNFYKCLSLIYNLGLKKGMDIKKIDLNYFDKINILDKLKIDSNIIGDFYYYLFLITKLQYKLDLLNIDLSSHDGSEIDIKKIDKNIISELNDNKKILNNGMIDFLKQIERSLINE